MSDTPLKQPAPALNPRATVKLEGLPIIIVFFVLIGLFVGFAPTVFLHWPIYNSFLVTIPPMMILSLGLTLVIAAGEIDLSFPAVIALSGFLFAYVTRTYDAPWLGLLAAIAGGALIGVVNGFLIAVIGIPSIIITIGTSFFWSGIATVLSGGMSYTLERLTGTAINGILSGTVLGIPSEAFWALGVAVVVWFILNRHRFGEHLLFIGDSREVARVVGINTLRERIKLFTLMGALGGFAAVLLTLENLSYFPTQGQGMLLSALAAVFIGGTSVFGGTATVVGSFFGALIIGMLDAGIVATGVAGFWVEVIVGLVFVSAVVLHIGIDDPARIRQLQRRLFSKA
ncbi:MAG: ABC transporter permease [Acidiphilium sp. 37-64-53]|uniref:ABC transporter permease n=1 Tax=Acidiphilium TaxID=522 RepID=UPI000BD6E1DA|nr:MULTISPECIES: ABC transporter permease [Acidiphilium]MBW4035763.1 ABC transporter permease [Pseudomonadota bacterium]OYW01655.1 MAG: ABC transporter permease [Acidiphilium sp. 37-64-53]OZB30009.1 MAG: ABC transporter permease [Acidiphilium sp. 34-64-41]HQT83673.1 ABC transporter permease [Acidiphilium rubrum]